MKSAEEGGKKRGDLINGMFLSSLPKSHSSPCLWSEGAYRALVPTSSIFSLNTFFRVNIGKSFYLTVPSPSLHGFPLRHQVSSHFGKKCSKYLLHVNECTLVPLWCPASVFQHPAQCSWDRLRDPDWDKALCWYVMPRYCVFTGWAIYFINRLLFKTDWGRLSTLLRQFNTRLRDELDAHK